jgi:FdhE protein
MAIKKEKAIFEATVSKITKRTDVISKQRPSHKRILEFFKDVLIEQYKIKSKVKTAPVELDEESFKVKIKEGFPLVEKKDIAIDIASATRLFRKLCKVLSHNKKTSRDAERLIQALRKKTINLSELFTQAVAENEEYIIVISNKLDLQDGLLSFLARNSIKPIFEAYADKLKGYVNQEMWWRGYCPICGSEPFIAELKEEGARFLVCSYCNYEWRFKRLMCPFCENEEPKGHRYFYTEEEGNTYRVDVCQKCKRYIKTVDIRELGKEVIPLIEDIGTLHLDILAQKEGYTREGKTHVGPIDA